MIYSLQSDEPVYSIVDTSRLSMESRIDVYPGEEEILDVAVRIEGESDCYGWNNEAYPSYWRTKDWKLPPSRYLVKSS